MGKPHKDTLVLSYIERAIPAAPLEEKLKLSHDFRRVFDAIFAIAVRLEEEERIAVETRDKSGGFASVRTTLEI